MEHAEAKREALVAKTDAALKEVAKIKAQLGEGEDGPTEIVQVSDAVQDEPGTTGSKFGLFISEAASPLSLPTKQAELMTCSSTIKGAHDQAHQVLLEWQSRKAARLSKFEASQVKEKSSACAGFLASVHSFCFISCLTWIGEHEKLLLWHPFCLACRQ